MSESGFRRTWKALHPNIVTARPMTDLCWTCQKNNILIYRSANVAEADKSERLLQQEQHLRVVKEERSFYNEMVRRAKDVCRQLEVSQLSANSPCSRQIAMHYSFDYAQQVHLPSDPLQPGPIYFLVPRKVGLFGVCCEGVPKQVNFLIDEAHLISKGSNAVFLFFTISSRILALVRLTQTFTVITALDKTRIVMSCGTVHGGFPLVSTKR